MLAIDIANRQQLLAVDEARLGRATRLILADAGIDRGHLSVAILDDQAIHPLNRQFFGHDYPTDVLSFLLEHDGDCLEGEIIASAETAARIALQLDWPADDELLLYVVHGTLHLVGFDDHEPEDRAAMRAAERRWLRELGVERRDDPGDNLAAGDLIN